MRIAITAPAARSSSRASAGERCASSSMRGPRRAQTTHGVIASTLAMRGVSPNRPGSPTTAPARRIATLLLPRRAAGHEDLHAALGEEVHRAVGVALLDQQVAGTDLVARQVGRDGAPVVERQAGAERVVRVERLHRPDQLVDLHRGCLRMPGRPWRSRPVPLCRESSIIDGAGSATMPLGHSIAAPSGGRIPRSRGRCALLADAEAAEDGAEQVVGGEGAGDLAERVVRQRAAPRRPARAPGRRRPACASAASQVGAGALQRVDVAGAGDERRPRPAACQPARSSSSRRSASRPVAGRGPRRRAPRRRRRDPLRRHGVDLVEDVERPLGRHQRRPVARRSAPRRRRSRARRAASGRAGRRPHRRRRSRPRCARRRCARPRRRLSRRPAVSITWTGTPSIWIVSPTLSRVVPGMAVTIASSAPASALSSELLPTFGWPASTTRMPSRSSAPWRARRQHRGDLPACASASRPRASARSRKSISSSGKSSVASTSMRSSTSCRASASISAREGAVERARRRARRGFGAGVDQVGDGLGLRQVELVVEEGALGELARPGEAQARQARRPVARRRCSAAASRQRASSSCSTTGPPCACSSSTSSPV